MNFEGGLPRNVQYQASYNLPQGVWGGNRFDSIKASNNNCLLIENDTFNIVSSANGDRVYYGTIDGDIVLMPLVPGVAPGKTVLNPVPILDSKDDLITELYEVHGLQLDYAGRVWAANAAGLFCFDASLQQCLFFMGDNRPPLEKDNDYTEGQRRLQTDYNKRYIYWLMAGHIVRVIDTHTCKLVTQDYQFNRDTRFDIQQWMVSDDGQFLFVLFNDTESTRDTFEVYNLMTRQHLHNYKINLDSREFSGDTRYHSFAVDFLHGKLVIMGISPDMSSDMIEDDQSLEEEEYDDETDPRDRELIIRTYQLTSNGLQQLGVQVINELDRKFYPLMINAAAFSSLEAENGTGACTLIASVLGGLHKQSNYLFLVRWNEATRKWIKHLTITDHHYDQQLAWHVNRNAVISTAADASLSINIFQ